MLLLTTFRTTRPDHCPQAKALYDCVNGIKLVGADDLATHALKVLLFLSSWVLRYCFCHLSCQHLMRACVRVCMCCPLCVCCVSSINQSCLSLSDTFALTTFHHRCELFTALFVLKSSLSFSSVAACVSPALMLLLCTFAPSVLPASRALSAGGPVTGRLCVAWDHTAADAGAGLASQLERGIHSCTAYALCCVWRATVTIILCCYLCCIPGLLKVDTVTMFCAVTFVGSLVC
jgi:hypothetical protein